MADELRDFFNAAVVRDIARDLKRVRPEFPDRRFVQLAVTGLAPLSLTGRANHIAKALHECLPKDFAEAAAWLSESLGPRHSNSHSFGMAPFKYFPHTIYVATYGLSHFEESMDLQLELTQRFSAEFSIRAFLTQHPETAYARLVEWAGHDNVHVRRLVSEGSRPRLPWAPRLRHFQADPKPVLALLELLKDDPELYVRRSVANSLNDIAKDHPDLAVATARRWMAGATDERRWIVRHALRFLIKQGHAGALDAVGAGTKPNVRVEKAQIKPARVQLGGTVHCTSMLTSLSRTPQDLLIDYRVHYVKANGTTSPKVFKLKRITLAPKQAIPIGIKVKLADLTTRKHHGGRHQIDLLVNGVPYPLGDFKLTCP